MNEIDMKRLGMVLNQPVFKAQEVFITDTQLLFLRLNFEKAINKNGEENVYDVALAFDRPEPN